MIFTDKVSTAIEEIARENSDGGEIDQHWESILPEVIGLFKNEIFIAQHRLHIDTPMIQSAFKHARLIISPLNTKELDIATLALYCWTSGALSGISKDRKFQSLVDQMDLANPSLIWRPGFGIHQQVIDAMVEHYERIFFAERCYAELVSRGRQNEYMKYTHVLLNKSDQFRPQQEVARERLCKISEIIATRVGIDSGDGEDLLHNFVAKLLSLPWHEQIQRAGATHKAIHDGAVDVRRKGGQHDYVSLDDDHFNSIPDVTAKDSIEEMIDNGEILKRILEHQVQIEKILSGGKAKLGKRRFQVLRKMYEGDTQKEIAKQLNISEPTITRDVEVIEQNRSKLKNLLLEN